MDLWLEIVVAIVLVVLAGCLVPLLLQLRRTAAAVQQLAEGAKADLHQVTTDMHHLRERADGLVDLAEEGLMVPVAIGRAVTRVTRTVEDFLGRSTLPWMSALMAGLKFVKAFVQRPQGGDAAKEAPHE